MTWIEIALIVLLVASILWMGYCNLTNARFIRRTIAESEAAIAYHSGNAGTYAKAMRTQGFALHYYANPQAWQSPERGKHSDAFRDRGERAREALEAAKKILEEGK